MAEELSLALNTFFALDNAANDYFRFLTDAIGIRPSYMENTPTNNEATGRIPNVGVFVGSLILGPGGEGSEAIKITEAGLEHALERHSVGGAAMLGKSVFHAGENIAELVKAAETVAPVRQAGGNFERVVQAGRIIGTDRGTGAPTSVYTVITNGAGELITAFPGRP